MRNLVFALAGVLFLLRLAYLIAFRFKTTTERPPKYTEVKAVLTVSSEVLIAIGAVILLVAGHWPLTLALVVGCVLLEYAARLYAYRRAVNEMYSWLTSIPVERRHQIATMNVDSDIKYGRRM